MKDITRIHTVQIHHKGYCPTAEIECMDDIGRRGRAGEDIQLLKINPNKYVGHYINSLGEFCDTMRRMQQEYGLGEYAFSRIDFACDNKENVYDERLKEDLAVVALLSLEKNLRNRFYSIDFLTQENLTMRAQSSSYVVENYNKYLESNGQDETKKRMEFRSLRRRCKTYQDIQKEIDRWIAALDKCRTHYTDLQTTMNDVLEEKLFAERRIYPVKDKDFVFQNRNFLFSKKQVVAFFQKIGKSRNVAYKFINKYQHIEWLSENDLRQYADEYIHALQIFRN